MDDAAACVEMTRRAVVAACLVLTACGGTGGPTGPTASSIAISGVTVLTPGLTTQLAAASTAIANSRDVVWHSLAPSVASVSSTGLVTALSAGTATITATVPAAQGQVAITVQPTSTETTVLSACRSIAMPGRYALDSNLTSTGECFTLSNVASVDLDCRGHTVTTAVGASVRVSNSSFLTASNCFLGNVVLNGVNGVTFDHGGVTGQLTITNGQSVVVSDSTITSQSVVVLVTSGTGVEFLRDTISNTGNGGASAIGFFNGANNRVIQSTIRGGYDGGHANVGTDDGVVLQNETGDTIEDNNISDFFDMGVEGVDTVANTTVANNTFSRLGRAGVGSLYCTSWTGDTIRGNHVSLTPQLASVVYELDLSHCGTTHPSAIFSGNRFIDNVFRDRIGGGAAMFIEMDGNVSGNLLQGNDFAAYDGPKVLPLSGFIDGGGNICGPLNPLLSTFVCTGGGTFTAGVLSNVFRRP